MGEIAPRGNLIPLGEKATPFLPKGVINLICLKNS